MIIRTIVNEKRDKRIIPAHATLREVWMRYIGSADIGGRTCGGYTNKGYPRKAERKRRCIRTFN